MNMPEKRRSDEYRQKQRESAKPRVARKKDDLRRLEEVAIATYEPLPPRPTGKGKQWDAMLDARLAALTAWHKRIMQASGCDHKDAVTASNRVNLADKPHARRRGAQGRVNEQGTMSEVQRDRMGNGDGLGGLG